LLFNIHRLNNNKSRIIFSRIYSPESNFEAMTLTPIKKIKSAVDGLDVRQISREIDDHIKEFAINTDYPLDKRTRNFLFRLNEVNDKLIKPVAHQLALLDVPKIHS